MRPSGEVRADAGAFQSTSVPLFTNLTGVSPPYKRQDANDNNTPARLCAQKEGRLQYAPIYALLVMPVGSVRPGVLDPSMSAGAPAKVPLDLSVLVLVPPSAVFLFFLPFPLTTATVHCSKTVCLKARRKGGSEGGRGQARGVEGEGWGF